MQSDGAAHEPCACAFGFSSDPINVCLLFPSTRAVVVHASKQYTTHETMSLDRKRGGCTKMPHSVMNLPLWEIRSHAAFPTDRHPTGLTHSFSFILHPSIHQPPGSSIHHSHTLSPALRRTLLTHTPLPPCLPARRATLRAPPQAPRQRSALHVRVPSSHPRPPTTR